MTQDVTRQLPLDPTRHVVLLQALSATPLRLAEVLDTLPRAALDWQSEPEAWSAQQLIGHLSEAEAPFLARLQRLLAEPNPWLPYFGPDVARPDRGEVAEHLTRFRARRSELVRFLCGLSAEDWDRSGVHETMGPTTLAQQVQNIANHDAEHLGQLRAACRAWESRPHA